MKNGKFRVLIIEDKFEEVLPVKVLLESMGCEVDVGTDGLSAVENLTKKDYDLLVLDWLMPDFNGNHALEYAEKFIGQSPKSNSPRRIIPFVAYTGLDVEKLEIPKVEYFEFISHWKKPFNLTELEEEVRGVLENLREAA